MKNENIYRNLITEKLNPIFDRIMEEARQEAKKSMNTSGEIDRETSKRIFEKATGSIVKDIIYGLGIENIPVRTFNPLVETYYENIDFWLFFNKAAVETNNRITKKQKIHNLMEKINQLYYCFTQNATEINFILNENENENVEDLSEDYEQVDVEEDIEEDTTEYIDRVIVDSVSKEDDTTRRIIAHNKLGEKYMFFTEYEIDVDNYIEIEVDEKIPLVNIRKINGRPIEDIYDFNDNFDDEQIEKLNKIILIIDILKDETESLDISLGNSRKIRNHLLELFRVHRITLEEWRDTMRYLSSYWLQVLKYDNIGKGV